MRYTRRSMKICALCFAFVLVLAVCMQSPADTVCAAALSGGDGSIEVSVDGDDLVISYTGSWKNYLSDKIQLSADGADLGAYSQIVLSANNSGDSGTYTVKNAWYGDIAGASVTVSNTDPLEYYGYNSMTWTIRVPLNTYDSYDVSELTLTWEGQSTTVKLNAEPEETTQEATTEDTEQTTQEATTEGTEQTTQEATTEGTEQTTQEATTEGGSGSGIVVGGGIQIDGYFDDWSGYPKTQITYQSNNMQCNHYGQLAIDGDTLYVHFKMNELYMSSMQIQLWYITINGQQYVLQIQPEKDGNIDWSTQVSREVGIHTNLKVFVGYGNNSECDSQVAYTVYNTDYGADGSQGDEIEFSLSLSKLAELTGISEESMGTITIYNPNIGSEGVTIAGSSTGAAVSVCLAAGMAFLYVAMQRKKKR